MAAKHADRNGREGERRSLRHRDIAPVHPGALLREMVLPALDLTVTDAAARLGVTRQGLHRLLAGTLAVTPATALRLGKFCGNGPTLWLGMQNAYDLHHAERALRPALARIETAGTADAPPSRSTRRRRAG